ncbi:NAC domain-containing protein 53 [Lactuca sativa]|uniref:NAC domain-containing protein 53 n=1 Tax=Lactuca sativa TaxID=4236 RepID=UPI000CD94E21|nr:NAC domain-containing protein 53 [Lactuca sativa]
MSILECNLEEKSKLYKDEALGNLFMMNNINYMGRFIRLCQFGGAGLSKLKSRDLEWYFFSVLDKKYGNGSCTKRATDKGYWKTIGNIRSIYHRSQLVGMEKKPLVYHSGRAPKGERTNWVMHEYILIDQELEKAGIIQDHQASKQVGMQQSEQLSSFTFF